MRKESKGIKSASDQIIYIYIIYIIYIYIYIYIYILFIRSIVHYSGTYTTREIQTAAINNYQVLLSLPGTSIGLMTRLAFSVMICNDAHVLLSTDASSWKSGTNMYEIVIAGWGNTRSVIRKVRQGAEFAAKQHSAGPLSCEDFRSFYVSWKNGVIEVGALVDNPSHPGTTMDEPPFLTYKDPSAFHVNYVYLAGWDKTGTWRIGEYVFLAIVLFA